MDGNAFPLPSLWGRCFRSTLEYPGVHRFRRTTFSCIPSVQRCSFTRCCARCLSRCGTMASCGAGRSILWTNYAKEWSEYQVDVRETRKSNSTSSIATLQDPQLCERILCGTTFG